MDSHEREYAAAVEGMDELYGVTPTPPICVTVGTRRIPTWNSGARVTWHDNGITGGSGHRTGIVVDIRYAGEDTSADRRIYIVKTRDPVSLQMRHVELTHESLCEW